MMTETFDFDGEYGAGYDVLVRRVVPMYEQIFSMAVALLDADLDECGRVLIVGSGSGAELVAFGDARPSWSPLATPDRAGRLPASNRRHKC